MKFGNLLAIGVVATIVSVAAPSAHATTLYAQGFETDTSDWSPDAVRVASGTGGIPSSGGAFHATASAVGAFHFFGAGGSVASNTTAPPYTASIDFYLDPNGGWADDRRFDYSVALSRPDSSFLRDFVFNLGYYDDALGSGSAGFVASASNNAGRANSFPSNPGRNPVSILGADWYTFTHTFTDNAGTLSAALSISDSLGGVVGSWEIGGDPISDVGGERYGWIVNNEFSTLAFDNVSLDAPGASVVPLPAAAWFLLVGVGSLGLIRRFRRPA